MVWRMVVTTQALELKLPPPLLPGCSAAHHSALFDFDIKLNKNPAQKLNS